MAYIVYTGILVVLWIINLFNGTGLDSIYHITQYAKYAVIIIFVLNVMIMMKRRRGLLVKKSDFSTFGLMIFSFCFSSFINGYRFQAIDYLWVFCLVYLLSRLEFKENTFFWTGILYGIAGLGILYIYDYGTFLSGWNDNSIAMIGMHSFLMMIIPFFNKSSKLSKVLLLLMTLVYSFLLQPTNSRSGSLFLFLGALFAMNLLPRKLVYKNQWRRIFILVVPLLIAILVTVVSKTSFYTSLNLWSMMKFRKPIFNGRDSIWQYGFNILKKHFIFGAGSMNLSNWHNSAITCLTAYGVIGYVSWISSFENIFRKAMRYIEDYLVQGCMISFIVLYLQQSVELGFISSSPSLLPYIMLGMMLGRVQYLKRENKSKETMTYA